MPSYYPKYLVVIIVTSSVILCKGGADFLCVFEQDLKNSQPCMICNTLSLTELYFY